MFKTIRQKISKFRSHLRDDIRNETTQLKKDIRNDIKQLKQEMIFMLKNIQVVDKGSYLYKNQVKFTCDLIGLVNEIFILEHYFLLPTKEEFIVIDIGANIGLSPLYFAHYPNITHIYAYEPVQETFNCMIRNIDDNPLLKHKIYPYQLALGKENKNQEISIGNRSTVSSFFPEYIETLTEYSSVEMVSIKSATEECHSIIKQHPSMAIILKIDTEGSEYDILENLYENHILGSINKVFIEFHQGVDSIPPYMEEFFDYRIIHMNPVNNKLFMLDGQKKG